MQCVILAGGYGTRLRPLTYTRQKVLLPVMNKPMIIHIIDALPAEVDRIIVAANYKKEQIERYFEIYPIPGKEVIVNTEPKPLGTAGAVKHAEKYLNGTFMVVNSDIVSSLNTGDLLDFHRMKNSVATISLWPVENVSEFGVVSVTDEGCIDMFVEKPLPEEAPSNLINAGHYCLEPEILDMIPAGEFTSMEKDIFPQVIRKHGRLCGFRFTGYWIDLGKVQNYLLAHKLIIEKNGMKRTYIEGTGCRNAGTLDYSSIGDGVVVGQKTVITSSVVFNGTTIGNDSHIISTVIGEKCRIGSRCRIINSVIGDEHVVPDGCILENAVVWNKDIPEGYPEQQVGNVVRDIVRDKKM